MRETLASLVRNPDQLEVDAGRQLLRKALGSGDAAVIAQAARLIEEHAVHPLVDDVRKAYIALSGSRAGTGDPGCVAKEALLDALEALDDVDLEVFADAANHEQVERRRGRQRDTAAGVRARGVRGLARAGHPDLWAILGARLADPEVSVRQAAARAIGHRGHRDGAGLLLLRLGCGDTEPEVVVDCIESLFAVAPDLGKRHARSCLNRVADDDRALLYGALGSASSDEAVALLAEELEEFLQADQRRSLIEALGLSRRPRARELLLSLVTSDREGDAELALAALSIHSYDDALVEQLSELTSGSPVLHRIFRERFQVVD